MATETTIMALLYIVFDFASHPLVIGFVLFFVGKHYWLDKYLLAISSKKDFAIKEKIIDKIFLIRNKHKLFKFYYDRLVNTSELTKEIKDQIDSSLLEIAYKDDMGEISEIINNDIPISQTEADSLLAVYFSHNIELIKIFGKYTAELEKIQKFVVNNFPNDRRLFIERSKSFTELDWNNIEQQEKKLKDVLMKNKSVFSR